MTLLHTRIYIRCFGIVSEKNIVWIVRAITLS